MSIYSARFFEGPLPTTWTTFYTAVDAVEILRDMELVGTAAGAATVQMTLTSASGSLSSFWYVGQLAGPQSHLQWTGRLVMYAGDTLGCNTNGVLAHGVLCGYRFSS